MTNQEWLCNLSAEDFLCNIKWLLQNYGKRWTDSDPVIIEWLQDKREIYTPKDKEMTNEQAKDIIKKYLALDSDVDSEYIQAQKVAVEALEQEPKTGGWLDWTDDRNDYLKCSICGYGEEGEVKFGEYTPYCPNCGSKMEGVEE